MESFLREVSAVFSSALLASPIIHILITFLLTSVVGAWLAQKHQQRNWRYQKKAADQDAERKAAEVAFREISQLMDKRLYRMRQLLWSLNRGDKQRIAEKLAEYRAVLYEWNDSNNVNLSRMEQYFGVEERRVFEHRISRDFIYIGMLLENWYFKGGSCLSFNEIFTKIDSLNALVYNLDRRMLAAIQRGSVGLFLEVRVEQ